MNNHWMRRTLLAVSIQLAIGGVYAAESSEPVVESVQEQVNSEPETQAAAYSDTTAAEQSTVSDDTQSTSSSQPVEIDKEATPSLVPSAGSQAADALQQKEVVFQKVC